MNTEKRVPESGGLDASNSTMCGFKDGAKDSSESNSDSNADRLLVGAPRITHDGREVPALGGIPLLKKIGQGGMGAVYYGFHPRLAQEVAIKVLPFPLIAQDPVVVQRFYREAQIAAKVKSAHLVSVMDVNEEAGLFYLVMEYVNGVTAGSYLSAKKTATGRALDESEALDICIGAAQGLAAAHAEGVIHRDLKPDNILIPRAKQEAVLLFENAKLADLGLARADDHGQSLTGSFAAMGSLGYMPPEQALDAKSVRKQGDVFSLGATLYALLTGHAPFQGSSTTAILLETLQKNHVSVREVRPDVSENTSRLLDKCLMKEPEKRFEDGDALLEALRACRSLVGIAAAPAKPAAPPKPAVVAAPTFPNLSEAPATPPVTPPVTPVEPALELGHSELALTPMGAKAEDSLALEPILTKSAENKSTGPQADEGVKKGAAKAGPRPAAPVPRKAATPAPAEAAPKTESAETTSPMKKYAIAGAGVAVLLLVVVVAFYMRGMMNDRAFITKRDQLLESSKSALKGGVSDVAAAKKGLEAFLNENANRNPNEVSLVRDLVGQLVQRKDELDKREQAFNDLLQKADRLRSTDVVKALEGLRAAESAGKADSAKGYPNLNESVSPTVAERIEKAEHAVKVAATAAEEAKQAYQKQMADAKTALESNKFADAEANYKQALVHKPGDAEAKTGLEKLADARRKAEDESKMAAGSEKRKTISAAIEKAIEAQRIEDWAGMEKTLVPVEKESIPDAALREKVKQLLDIARTELKTHTEASKLIDEGERLLQEKQYEQALKSFKEAIALWPEARANERVKKGMADAQAGQAGVAVAQVKPKDNAQPGPAVNEKPMGQGEKPPGEKPPGEKPPGERPQGNGPQPPEGISENFKKAMAQGDRLMKEKKYQEAITQYSVCLKERPSDPRATECIRQAKEAIRTGDSSVVNLPPGGPPGGGGGEEGGGPPPEGGPGGQGGPGGRPPRRPPGK